MAKDIKKWIEKYVRIFMPMLFIFGIIIGYKSFIIRQRNSLPGLANIWEPNFQNY